MKLHDRGGRGGFVGMAGVADGQHHEDQGDQGEDSDTRHVARFPAELWQALRWNYIIADGGAGSSGWPALRTGSIARTSGISARTATPAT